MSVVDLGGRVGFWRQLPVRPKYVHVVSLEPAPADLPEWVEVDHGDACALPAEIADRRYDLVFSNSVIEHVGGHRCRLRFAEAVHALAPAYWVQTPYRYFPIEPHWIAPGMQFLPVVVRREVAREHPRTRTGHVVASHAHRHDHRPVVSSPRRTKDRRPSPRAGFRTGSQGLVDRLNPLQDPAGSRSWPAHQSGNTLRSELACTRDSPGTQPR
jgi:hypothetical protein